MMKKLLRLATFALLFSGVASAQSTGTITGVVTDGATGKPVVGALVVATSPAVPGQQTAVTDAKGSFTVSNLPAGQYKLQASFDGYKPEVRADLALGENVTLRANLAIVPEAVQLEEVVVTGSRIKRKDLTTPAPVTVVNREQILASGKISIGDFLQTLPEQGNTVNAQVNNGNDGSVRVDLRSLGSNRTLVLVNGRRMVAGGTGADNGVDLNTIPAAAVERIEVLKDGASAVYGSDAIAGVVNVILKKRFDGTEASVFAGTSSRGDGNRLRRVRHHRHQQREGQPALRGRLSRESESDHGRRIVPSRLQRRPTTALQRARRPRRRQLDAPSRLAASSSRAGQLRRRAGRCEPGLPPARRAAPLSRTTCDQSVASAPAGSRRPNPAAGPAPATRRTTLSLFNTNPTNFIITPAQRVQIFSTGDAKLGTVGRAFYESSYVDRKSETTLAPMPLVNNTIPTARWRSSPRTASTTRSASTSPPGASAPPSSVTGPGSRTSTPSTWWPASTARSATGPARSAAGTGIVSYNFGRTWATRSAPARCRCPAWPTRSARAAGSTRPTTPGAQCIKYGPTYATNPNDYKVIPGCVPMNVLRRQRRHRPARRGLRHLHGTDSGTPRDRHRLLQPRRRDVQAACPTGRWAWPSASRTGTRAATTCLTRSRRPWTAPATTSSPPAAASR